MPERFLRPLRQVAWAALLVFLPITSMPLVQRLVGSSAVAAPSILALVILVLVWLLPFLVLRGRLPALSLPLFAFILVALLSCAAAFFLPIPLYKQQAILPQEIEGLVTLAIGLCFYLVTATLVRTSSQLSATLRWINLGGMLLILWSLAQAAAWFSLNRYPEWMRAFQDLISMGPLYRQRVTGFAIEPSWLAHQLNMLYLPLWLSATVQRVSAHRPRLFGLTAENILLVLGVAVLALSFSRVGFAAFFACLAYLFLRFNRWLAARLRAGLAARFTPRSRALPPFLLSLLVTSALSLVYIGLFFGGLYALSQFDPRMANIFRPSYWQSGDFFVLANRLQFGERAAYWQAGWVVFNLFPWLGVGLGNAGFFFRETLPAYAWNFVEVRRIMAYQEALPNTKSLWVRLLAETGALGVAFYLAWLVLLGLAASWLSRSAAPLQRWIGMAGIFVLIGLVFEGFSIDSFALPYNWITLGLLTAAVRIEKAAVP